MEHLKIIAGTENRSLAEEVAKNLKMKLTPAEIKRFPDGEIYVHILESVRGCDVYVIQPTSPDGNQNLMELLIMVDALKRSSPNKIIAVIPYFGYCRQDRKAKAREPITAKLVAKMIETAGVDRPTNIFFPPNPHHPSFLALNYSEPHAGRNWGVAGVFGKNPLFGGTGKVKGYDAV